jgi:hypothetical protein
MMTMTIRSWWYEDDYDDDVDDAYGYYGGDDKMHKLISWLTEIGW